jgi:DNA-directed RNA polymerase sigma subunit (sigma70/sigma32)
VSAERVRQIEQRALDKLQLQSCIAGPAAAYDRSAGRA